MALSLRKQYERANKRIDKAINAVYSSTTRNDLPFSECLKVATLEVKAEYESASSDRARLRYVSIAAGKAWESTHGLLTWN